MTEQTNNPVNESPTIQQSQDQQRPAPQLSTHQLDSIKLAMINNAVALHDKYLQSLITTPGEAGSMAEAFRYYNTAFLHLKDAIIKMDMKNFSLAPVNVQAPQPQAPSQSQAQTQEGSTPEAPTAPTEEVTPPGDQVAA